MPDLADTKPSPSPAGPRFLYLHGFASGPESSKGRALAARFAARGLTLERLDLRVPSLESLRLSRMIDAVGAAIGGPRERVVLLGSSLGGLTAARVAEEDPRVAALVLLAPAFRLAERWRARMGEEAFEAWRASGRLAIDDYAEKRKTHVDFGFFLDAEQVERARAPMPDVRVPSLVIHGQRDDVVDPALSRAFAEGRRHVRLVEVDDAHELTASIDRIGREVDAFLAPFFGVG
jgi:pimeloyl-ACP methyl ester carboxylesterase